MKSFIYMLTLLPSPFLIRGAYGSSPFDVSHPKLFKKRSSPDDGQSDLSQKLFPSAYQYSSGFTTASGVFSDGVLTVPLDDTSLNVFGVQNDTTHNVVWQNGKLAWEAVYPKDSINPGNPTQPPGGFGFFLGGANTFFDDISNGAQEVIMSYSVMFEDGFEFNMGGKLPGAFGGLGEGALSCTGGRQEDRMNCFNARLMWREDGAGEIYTYIPQTEANIAAQLAVPGTVDNQGFGYSVGRGAYYFPTGEWVTVAQRVRLNTLNNTDGLIDLWVDGVETIKLRDITLLEAANSTIRGSHYQTFFGGSTIEWASPKTQKAWIADVSGAIIKS